MFPEQKRFIFRYEKRVETLKAIGYRTPDGGPTREFRLHFALRHGINTPELQRIRLQMATRAARDAPRGNEARGASMASEQVRPRRRMSQADGVPFGREDARAEALPIREMRASSRFRKRGMRSCGSSPPRPPMRGRNFSRSSPSPSDKAIPRVGSNQKMR
jgi:hypothetical protein